MGRLELTRFLRRFDRSAAVFVNGPSAFRDPLPRAWLRIWNAAPLRFCLDGAANRLRVLCRDGLAEAPTTISGDFDSLSEESRAFFESRSRIVETHDQDETDMTKALRILAREELLEKGKVDFVVLLGGFSGRFDHTMASIKSMLVGLDLLGDVPLVALDENNLVTVLPKGQNEILLDRSILTGICGFIPFCQRRITVTTRGFRWNLEDQELSFDGIISTSNELTADRVEILSDAPVLFTVELKETL